MSKEQVEILSEALSKLQASLDKLVTKYDTK
jgi:hypothetical protein